MQPVEEAPENNVQTIQIALMIVRVHCKGNGLMSTPFNQLVFYKKVNVK